MAGGGGAWRKSGWGHRRSTRRFGQAPTSSSARRGVNCRSPLEEVPTRCRKACPESAPQADELRTPWIGWQGKRAPAVAVDSTPPSWASASCSRRRHLILARAGRRRGGWALLLAWEEGEGPTGFTGIAAAGYCERRPLDIDDERGAGYSVIATRIARCPNYGDCWN